MAIGSKQFLRKKISSLLDLNVILPPKCQKWQSVKLKPDNNGIMHFISGLVRHLKWNWKLKIESL